MGGWGLGAGGSLASAGDTGHWVCGSLLQTQHVGPYWNLGLRHMGLKSPISSSPQVREKHLSAQETQNPLIPKVEVMGNKVWQSLFRRPCRLSSVKPAWFSSGFSRGGGSGQHSTEQHLLSHSGPTESPSFSLQTPSSALTFSLQAATRVSPQRPLPPPNLALTISITCWAINHVLPLTSPLFSIVSEFFVCLYLGS